jgi:hypothetical protein
MPMFDPFSAVVGAALGVVIDWKLGTWLRELTQRRKLKRTYGHLVGLYRNFRLNEDRAEVPTGGKIKLDLQPDGSFKAKGLHATGDTEWESDIRMSLEWNNSGRGRYKYLGSADYGNQQITYLPETHSLSVVGTNLSGGRANTFVHHWKRIEAN